MRNWKTRSKKKQNTFSAKILVYPPQKLFLGDILLQAGGKQRIDSAPGSKLVITFRKLRCGIFNDR